jgi:hypothetical protein
LILGLWTLHITSSRVKGEFLGHYIIHQIHDIKLNNIEKLDFLERSVTILLSDSYPKLCPSLFTLNISKSVWHAHLKNFGFGMCVCIYIYICEYVYKTLIILSKYIATYNTIQQKVSLYTEWFH